MGLSPSAELFGGGARDAGWPHVGPMSRRLRIEVFSRNREEFREDTGAKLEDPAGQGREDGHKIG